MDSIARLILLCFAVTVNVGNSSSVRRVIYYAGRTIAVADLNTNNDKIVSCCLETIKDDKDLQKVVVSQTKRRVQSIKKVSIDFMIALIGDCAYLDERSEHTEVRDFARNSDLVTYLTNEFRSVHGSEFALYDGTRWCGYNNNAKSYFDIGEKEDLDRCCRAHDFCPYFQQSFTLKNLSPITKSACGCDLAFFNCLIAVNSSDANKVGNIFFNSATVECVQLTRHFKCQDTECKTWEEDDTIMPEVVVTNLDKEYPYHPKNFKTSLDLDLIKNTL